MYAGVGEFPHVVSLRRGGAHFCGGSIIGPQHILTAAHCVEGNMIYPYTDITVVSGSNYLSQGGTVHTIKRATANPFFIKAQSTPNDVAVLTVRMLNDNVKEEFSISLRKSPCSIFDTKLDENRKLQSKIFDTMLEQKPANSLKK